MGPMDDPGSAGDLEESRWDYEPELRRPVVVAAFEGWNDAGDAATHAARWLHDRWSAKAFASIDPEGFYDFTSADQLRLVHDPSVSHNLRVTNNRLDSVEVIVGITEYGKVPPGQSLTFFIDVGRRDLFFRRTGSSTADHYGTFNFNTTTVVEATYN